MSSDCFILSIQEVAHLVKQLELTKRHIVSVVERIYDPLGYLSPIVVWFKFQELANLKQSETNPLLENCSASGIPKKLSYEGLHIIAIRRNSTMNIHNFHSGKHLLSWDRDKLRRSGCIGSLVFMEAGRRCYGGPGLLWMCCPVSVAGKFRECLHK